jgi:hypothetical protein
MSHFSDNSTNLPIRREFLKATLGLSCLPLLKPLEAFAAASRSSEDPHSPPFFIFLNFSGGLDFSPLWDARPLSLRDAKIRADYLGEEPQVFSPKGGGSTLVSSLFDRLRPHQDLFSIINGLHMSADFDGHEQNRDLLFTGNPFGGEFFVPHLNLKSAPMDALVSGSTSAKISNGGKLTTMSLPTMKQVIQRAGRTKALTEATPLFKLLKQRYETIAGEGNGSVSLGARLLLAGLYDQQKVHSDFKSIPLGEEGVGQFVAYLKAALELFRLGTTRALVLHVSNPGGNSTDTHDFDSASKGKALLSSALDRIIPMLEVLKGTPFDETRSFAEVTTFLIGSEFGRSNRQANVEFEKTGTDHNPFNSSFLIGGKGIVAGKVVGESDLRLPDEKLSGAHLKRDAKKLILMGKPYDFRTQEVRSDLPDAYIRSDYLNSASLLNTVYRAFSVPESHYRTIERDGPLAPTIRSLLRE